MLDESQAGIKIARKNINNLRYADNTILMAEEERGTKNLLLDEGERRERTKRLFFVVFILICLSVW